MSTAEILLQIRALPLEERREFLGRIREEFESELTPAQAAELDWRLEEHARNPGDVVPWTEIKAAAETKYQRKP